MARHLYKCQIFGGRKGEAKIQRKGTEMANRFLTVVRIRMIGLFVEFGALTGTGIADGMRIGRER